jgi:acetyl-CoA C-acetyltransferase
MIPVAIAGVGSTRFGRHEGVTPQALAIRAGRDAIRQSGLDRADIDALYLGNFLSGVLTGQEVLAGLVAQGLGLGPVPATKVEGACASGGIAFRHAVMAVASGQARAALAVGVEMMTGHDTARVTAALNAALDNSSDGATGLSFPGLFGLLWRAHAARHGTTRAAVSAVAVKNRRNGLRNPVASMGADLTPEQVAEARPIADPVRLFDCSGIADGAAAVLVTARARIPGDAPPPVDVLATAQTCGPPRISAFEDLTSFSATVTAARLAYAQSGLGPADIDVVELHDCFSIAEIVDSEDLGLVPRGEGGLWAERGDTDLGGRIPINPSGGLLAKGHPVGATGLGQICELVTQLRGDHPTQVPDARIGLAHNLGGAGVACTVSILGRADGRA